MSKKLQLSIPTPCHENWDNMTPVAKGKFCDSCQKQVMDFSNMSDREIAQFFKKPSTGSVCGRFMQDQLDRSIEIPKKRIPWIKYFFQITIPIFLANLKGTAQGNVVMGKPKAAVCTPLIKGDVEIKGLPKNILGDTISISLKNNLPLKVEKSLIGSLGAVAIIFETKSRKLSGKVIDEKENPISYATVQIKGTKIATSSDSIGNFKLNINREQNQVTLVASYVGFETIEKSINLSSDLTTDIIMQSTPMLSGEVVVAGLTVRKKVRPELKNVPLLPKIKLTPFKFFRLYPNPIKANTLFTIEWKKAETGNYVLELFDQSGQLTFTKEIWIDDEARVLNLQIPSVAAGDYFLKMTNKKSGKSYTEKLIIQ